MLENLPINISPDRPQWHTPAEIHAAAAEGLRIDYNAGRGHVIRCRKAANVGGWITAVMEHGSILQAWAGEFTVAGEVSA
jgi:hypothetical protein